MPFADADDLRSRLKGLNLPIILAPVPKDALMYLPLLTREGPAKLPGSTVDDSLLHE